MKNVLTQVGAAVIMLMVLLVPRGTWAQDSKFSMGFMAATTSWDTGFNDLQTPGWEAHFGGHPGGIMDFQYKFKNGTGLFVEVAGDPHRPREATSYSIGLRHNLVSYKRLSLYGQVSVGTLEAPSFLEYCGSYEYRNGNCGMGTEDPEYCNWASLNGGFGLRVHVSKKFDIEAGRAEYLAVYGISPRFRFSAGFRVGL